MGRQFLHDLLALLIMKQGRIQRVGIGELYKLLDLTGITVILSKDEMILASIISLTTGSSQPTTAAFSLTIAGTFGIAFHLRRQIIRGANPA